MSDRTELIEQIKNLAVVHGRSRWRPVRKPTTTSTCAGDPDGVAALVGRVMRDLTADWAFEAAGGLTLGADPVAVAMLHAAAADGERLDAFVVRKSAKGHGMQRQIEGTPVQGRPVLLVEDTSTTGGSVMTAVEAVREAGGTIVGVAVIVDRDTGARERIESRSGAARHSAWRPRPGKAPVRLAQRKDEPCKYRLDPVDPGHRRRGVLWAAPTTASSSSGT